MVTRHEFLAELHAVIQPKRYLEIGVQYGTSLQLARAAEVAIGIDPQPQTWASGNQQIHTMTSDDFFMYNHMEPEETVDFAFIDGSHLFEDALRDFINVEKYSHPKTVVVFDDVLPMTEEMASRMMIPGHWTGDVWKVHPAIQTQRPELTCMLVDTEPTGTMVVLGLDQKDRVLPYTYPQMLDQYQTVTTVPERVLKRTQAVSAAVAVERVKTFLQTGE